MERKGDPDYSFKLVIVGDSGVGKTNLLTRFTRDQFSLNLRNTVGMNSDQRTLMVDDKYIRAEIWDTAGQERYRSMSPSFYRGAVGALIVYDVTNADSFNNLSKWITELSTHADKLVASLLIGNKSDRTDRAVTTDAANSFATKHKFALIETSALDATNVEQAFDTILKEIVNTTVKYAKEGDSDYSYKDNKSRKLEGIARNSIHQGKNCLCCGTN